MTMVTVGEGRGVRMICADGHATGSEAVCAAVSAIMYALAGWVENNCQNRRHEIAEGDGYVLVSAERCHEVDTAFELTYIGLLQIEKQHPEYIRIDTL